MKDSIRLYYGEDAEAIRKIPLALLDSNSTTVLTPRLLLGIGERNIPCLHPAMMKFDKTLKTKGALYDDFVATGHNHVNWVFVLGIEGEEWAEHTVVKWIHAPRT